MWIQVVWHKSEEINWDWRKRKDALGVEPSPPLKRRGCNVFVTSLPRVVFLLQIYQSSFTHIVKCDKWQFWCNFKVVAFWIFPMFTRGWHELQIVHIFILVKSLHWPPRTKKLHFTNIGFQEEGASFGHQIFRVEAGTLPQIYIAASRPPPVLTFRKLPGVFFNWICTYL